MRQIRKPSTSGIKDVEEHEVGPPLLREPHGVAPAPAGDGPVAAPLELEREEFEDLVVVVDDEDAGLAGLDHARAGGSERPMARGAACR
ncbi:MAG: hypothetical protein U0166_24495 [Acidobacteriota bacterium]